MKIELASESPVAGDLSGNTSLSPRNNASPTSSTSHREYKRGSSPSPPPSTTRTAWSGAGVNPSGEATRQHWGRPSGDGDAVGGGTDTKVANDSDGDGEDDNDVGDSGEHPRQQWGRQDRPAPQRSGGGDADSRLRKATSSSRTVPSLSMASRPQAVVRDWHSVRGAVTGGPGVQRCARVVC